VPQQAGGRSDVVVGKVIIDFLPHIAVVPGSRPFIDIPATKLDRRTGTDEAVGFHVTKPDEIVSCHDKLCVWKLSLHQRTNLATVACIDRHENIVEHRKRERSSI
jgi:hypothetical protein